MAEPPDPDFAPTDLLALMPFAAGLGIELGAAGPSEVTGRLQWREDLCTAAGVLHGGVLMSLADSLGALCAYLNMPPGVATATTASTTNFVRALREGHAEARSRPLHVGRSMVVVQTEVRDAGGKLLAHTTQSQAVLSG